ncbi:MAG TPA: extracellular solute-binding protein [Galbitalea sp.]|nr:extracellular solute-binding protein [Galbitalea sp.]
MSFTLGKKSGSSHSRRRSRGVVAAIVAGLSLALVLAGCAGAPAKSNDVSGSKKVTEASLLKSALAGPPLSIYGAVNPTSMANMIKAFEAEYNVNVVYTDLVQGPMIARYTAEAQAGNVKADLVFSGDPTFFNDGASAKWFQPVNTKDIPNARELPKQYFYGNSLGVGVQRLDGVITNSKSVSSSEVPKTWKSITDPKWQGQVAALDPRPISVAMYVWEELDKKYGDKFLEGVAKQNVEWTPSGLPGAEAIAAGEKKAFYGGSQGFTAPVLATAPNANLNPVHIFSDLHIGYIWNAGVSKNSPNPAAAKLFLSWLLTPQGQRLMGSASDQPSVLPNVVINGAVAPEKDFFVIKGSVSTAEGQRLTQLLGLQ